MPVLQVFVPADDAVRERLADCCAVVAEALGLPDDGVIATHVPVGATVRPGHEHPSWPVVVIHGTARDPQLMLRAREAVEGLARGWVATPDGAAAGEPWVTWQVRVPEQA
ncbi:MAG: hypothetical protein U0R80_05600 [Nocardioidaceae bacterium]